MKLLKIINKDGKVAEYMVSKQKLIAFFYRINDYSEYPSSF